MREAEPPMGGLKISFRVGGTSAKAIARVETDDIAAEADSPVFVEQGPSDDDPEYSGEIGIETDSDEDWLDVNSIWGNFNCLLHMHRNVHQCHCWTVNLSLSSSHSHCCTQSHQILSNCFALHL